MLNRLRDCLHSYVSWASAKAVSGAKLLQTNSVGGGEASQRWNVCFEKCLLCHLLTSPEAIHARARSVQTLGRFVAGPREPSEWQTAWADKRCTWERRGQNLAHEIPSRFSRVSWSLLARSIGALAASFLWKEALRQTSGRTEEGFVLEIRGPLDRSPWSVASRSI